MRQSANKKILYLTLLLGYALVLIHPSAIFAQENKWIRVGMLHDWFLESGSEPEVGRRGLVRDQQDGLQWPAQFRDQDSQAAKGLWFGAANYNDIVANAVFPHKVVEVGPRGSDEANEVMPMEFKMIGRFDHPTVLVDGDLATDLEFDDLVDEIDPNITADRIIINKVRSSMGIEMTRKIYAFSQQFHNNYFIYEYTFTNTGIVDLAGTQNHQTLEDAYFMWQYRYAICKEVGAYGKFFMPQNSTWGRNTMNDAIGEDPNSGDPFRAMLAWHGLHSTALFNGANFDNIGAPNVQANGRLTAHQFTGVVIIHADKSPGDNSDDPAQPSNTWYIDSDGTINQGGFHNQYNPTNNTAQYEFMRRGHPAESQAEAVGDGFADQFGETGGGFSQVQGFGPYTLADGDSIKIVMAEAVAGINWDKTIEVGANWFNETGAYILPNGQATSDRDQYKDAWVFTGRDSLLQTFQRAIDNWNAGLDIPQPPPPPDLFEVNGGGDRIQLTWSNSAESWPGLAGYKIFRAVNKPDTTYEQIADVPVGTLNFDDTQASRGFDYYYYIVTYDDGSNNNSALNPGGSLQSSLFYTRTNLPTNLKRPAGNALSELRVVPNPYNIRAARTLELGYGLERIAFLDIPAFCKIKIFTERGDLIQEIEHTDGTGDEFWDLITSSRQLVVSGIYIAYFEVTEDFTDPATGAVLYKRGDNTFRKFVIIR